MLQELKVPDRAVFSRPLVRKNSDFEYFFKILRPIDFLPLRRSPFQDLALVVSTWQGGKAGSKLVWHEEGRKKCLRNLVTDK